ncbi:hypothetical protein B1H58_20610 (plasmid) [Pantoea alhagi]|uniref:Uncharacterized protein n=1 Tax=Pantoea alhagi TaxID=1891675 RepID=A0A1W6BBH8_9GAMM|nr:hypothetical protein [Pantoea alhagi]ARJ44421.1 hypothetical protein B1H58_20610 [Pantoea alhagi]
MYESMNRRDDFSYAFEKIRNAVASSAKRDAEFANDMALKILREKYAQFRQELNDAGELGDHEYDLDTFEHAMDVLQRYFDGNPGGLTERDARIYSHYLQTEHQGFSELAKELATGRS